MAISTNRHESYNYEALTHRGKMVTSILSSSRWGAETDYVKLLPAKLATVPAGMEGRPDLISNDVYGTSMYWWVICVANNITDPFEQLTAGKMIRIPQMV